MTEEEEDIHGAHTFYKGHPTQNVLLNELEDAIVLRMKLFHEAFRAGKLQDPPSRKTANDCALDQWASWLCLFAVVETRSAECIYAYASFEALLTSRRFELDPNPEEVMQSATFGYLKPYEQTEDELPGVTKYIQERMHGALVYSDGKDGLETRPPITKWYECDWRMGFKLLETISRDGMVLSRGRLIMSYENLPKVFLSSYFFFLERRIKSARKFITNLNATYLTPELKSFKERMWPLMKKVEDCALRLCCTASQTIVPNTRVKIPVYFLRKQVPEEVEIEMPGEIKPKQFPLCVRAVLKGIEETHQLKHADCTFLFGCMKSAHIPLIVVQNYLQKHIETPKMVGVIGKLRQFYMNPRAYRPSCFANQKRCPFSGLPFDDLRNLIYDFIPHTTIDQVMDIEEVLMNDIKNSSHYKARCAACFNYIHCRPLELNVTSPSTAITAAMMI